MRLRIQEPKTRQEMGDRVRDDGGRGGDRERAGRAAGRTGGGCICQITDRRAGQIADLCQFHVLCTGPTQATPIPRLMEMATHVQPGKRGPRKHSDGLDGVWGGKDELEGGGPERRP